MGSSKILNFTRRFGLKGLVHKLLELSKVCQNEASEANGNFSQTSSL